MVTVTPEAKELLHEVLEQAGETERDVAIRLAAATGPTAGEQGEVQLGMMLDQPQDGDQVVEHQGKKVLLVDHTLSDMLDGATLDTVDTPEGKQLVINQ